MTWRTVRSATRRLIGAIAVVGPLNLLLFHWNHHTEWPVADEVFVHVLLLSCIAAGATCIWLGGERK